NCLQCHARNQTGGLSIFAADLMKKSSGKAETELTLPPVLTQVGVKLRRNWLEKVLLHAGQGRPWMSMRMPQFGAPNVGSLVDALPKADGAEPTDAVHAMPFSTTAMQNGRFLVSRRAFGCLKCHEIAGVQRETGGVRGPDVAYTQDRLQYDWFKRWMLNPQRLDPATKMPANFTNNKSAVLSIHDGDAFEQIDALWSYFSLGGNMPLPTENEPPEKTVLQVAERSVILRSFLPDVGPWSFAVGHPDQVSTAFDARQCRLVYAWSGGFIDVGPSWNNRGGGQVKLMGNRFWDGPGVFPWSFTASDAAPPDVARENGQPALFGAVPEGTPPLPQDEYRLKFLGVRVDTAGAPTFRYHWRDIGGAKVAFEHRPGGLRCDAGVGVRQTWTLTAEPGAAGLAGWLLVGESRTPPRLLQPDGSLVESPENQEVPAAAALLLETPAPRVVRVDGGAWWTTKAGDRWIVLRKTPASGRVVLDEWTPFRVEPAVLKLLAASFGK
ncbi:MAG: hypothetical protein ACRC1K_00445, partial [Planctomycetia bacterium]